MNCQSWVLILIPTGVNRWPAIIGGYTSRDEAEAAGYAAKEMPPEVRKRHDEAMAGRRGGFGGSPAWDTFYVIPGAASAAPEAAQVDGSPEGRDRASGLDGEAATARSASADAPTQITE